MTVPAQENTKAAGEGVCRTNATRQPQEQENQPAPLRTALLSSTLLPKLPSHSGVRRL